MTVEYNKGTACPILLSTKESTVALTMDSAKKLQADLAKVIEQAEKEPEISEFEMAIHRSLNLINGENLSATELLEETKGMAAELLDLVKQQRLQSGELMTQEHHEKLMETLCKECKKDLPRWKKCDLNTFYNTKCNFVVNGIGRYLILDGYMIDVDRLEKLPGFKEDESHE